MGPDIPLVFGNPARGRDAFVEKGCISCHAVRGSGGKRGPDLAAALVGKGVDGIAAAMISHYPKMNAAMQKRKIQLPLLSAADLDDVVAYLVFINFAREPGSVDKGRVLFHQKGCTRCHRFAPGGISAAPPLGRAALAASPIVIAQQMWNHGAVMSATMEQLQVPRSTFEGSQMADVLAFLSAAGEPLPGSGVPLPGDPTVGRGLFQSKGCVRCHIKGDTEESVGPDLSAGGWYETATEIAGEMWNHGPAMWARMRELGITPSRFEDNEMADVLAYLYLLRSASEPGNSKRGREVFTVKHCEECHKAGGAAPDLATVGDLDTPIHLAAAMWNHAPGMQAFVIDARIPWPTFDATDVRDLVAFLGQGREKAAD
jgi:mono/diheme cytochrome c family protein